MNLEPRPDLRVLALLVAQRLWPAYLVQLLFSLSPARSRWLSLSLQFNPSRRGTYPR